MPRPQRRQRDVHDVEAIVQSLRETSPLRCRLRDRDWSRRRCARRTRPRLDPPTGRTRDSCRARSSLACISRGMSPISSRKRVPPVACTSRPSLSVLASVNAPRTCPKSSLSNSCAGTAEQLMATKAASARGLRSCSARATSSFPVPLSPVMSTEMSAPAMRRTRSLTRDQGRALAEKGQAVGARQRLNLQALQRFGRSTRSRTARVEAQRQRSRR
jgi:hypothetical protein